jgi:hypothetical protein
VQLKVLTLLSSRNTNNSSLIVPKSHHGIVLNIPGQGSGKQTFNQKAGAIVWRLWQQLFNSCYRAWYFLLSLSVIRADLL